MKNLAVMSPAQLTETIRQDPGRQAEVAVFDALQLQLNDSCTVFYSVEWNAPTGQREAVQDGEADFVVAHPKHGFLVLEVKGGIVCYDPEEQQWTSTSRSGYVNRISDPFKQARKSCYGLIGRTKKMVSQGGCMRIFHAAVFPHCVMRVEELPGSGAPEIVIDANGMNQLGLRITGAFSYWINEADLRGPSFEEVIKAIRRIHNSPVTGRRDMSLEIVEHHTEFDRLTENQGRVLDMVSANRRLLVRGCAGSGKTFLAKRLAAKRSAQGERVLVLCFNNLLGSLLDEELGGLPNVIATNFHLFCEHLVNMGSIDIGPKTAESASDYYSALTEAALKALEADSSLRFDTVIIDEAQDFELDWWIVIEQMLEGEKSSLCVFIDANQLLYGTTRGVPGSLGPFAAVELSENVRNTQAIHREAIRFFQGEQVPGAIGPEGVPPQWIEANSESAQIEQLEKIITRLVLAQKVAPADIAILTPKGSSSTTLQNLGALGTVTVAPYDERESDEVGWSTIRKFKGLESPIVIIVEVDDGVAQSDRLRELVYVGITRARDYLFVIGSRGALKNLKAP